MPVNPTYPGVYIEEIPSGVRTITGVATSITAFLGLAKRGPVNKAVHIFSLKEYEDKFGGLSSDFYMGYAVSQFFLNGGTEAWIVRLAKNAKYASLNLQDITITAVDEGTAANDIQVFIDDHSTDPTISSGMFNLRLSYAPQDDPADSRTETFKGLSMDPRDHRYITNVINDVSQLVKVSVNEKSTAVTTGLQPGKLTSGSFASDTLANLNTLPDGQHDSFNIGLDGMPATNKVTLDTTVATKQDIDEKLKDLASRIETAVHNLNPGSPSWRGFTCTVSPEKNLVFASGTIGPDSAVSVADVGSTENSIYHELHLDNPTATPGSIPHSPVPLSPHPGKLTSGGFAATELANLPSDQHTSFKIGFDGNPADTVVTLDKAPAVGSDLKHKLDDIASRILKAVRALKPGLPAWSGFTCTVSTDEQDNAKKVLVFASGTIGPDSAVSVADVGTSEPSIFGQLHLDNPTATKPGNPALSGGTADPFDLSAGLEEIFPTDRSRTGIFALDEVPLVNLLCIPGVTDPGILNNAIDYCKKRRAFMIVDPDPSLDRDGMVKFIMDPNLPKADLGTYAAIYFPWVKAPDPLNNGKLRSFPPSGMIAGLYARTDSTRGVWKAPAGTDATLVSVRALDVVLTDEENGSLNPLGVNCLRNFPVIGPVCWGARTASGADQLSSEYKYVPIRRLALFIEESLFLGTHWVVFEPNDEPLWAQIRLNVGAFMHDLFRKGAFQGSTASEAYFVKCDKETTTQNDQDHGIVNIIVGFAPLKPAEFVIIALQQMAGQIQV